MIWVLLDHRVTEKEHLGSLPKMLNEHDPRPAREQLDAGYRHGGGWSPFKGRLRDARLHPRGDARHGDAGPASR
jgi:hypothetical protein